MASTAPTRRLSGTVRTVALAVVTAVLATGAAPRAAPGQGGDALARAVEAALEGDRALRRIEVSADGEEVTLAGPVRTFWEKNEALRRTFDVDGVGTVVSEIEVPAADSEADLAEAVVEAIQGYAHYRIWDDLEARLDRGVVTLTGRVTPERDKAGELFERVAKVPGVQDVQVDIQTLPPNRQDQELRQAIARRVFASEHFERFRSMNNPPFHIVVHNSVVTLIGYVQSNIERIEIERIVGQTQGVLRVENQLETVR